MKEEKYSIKELFRINRRGLSFLFSLTRWNAFFGVLVAELDVIDSYWGYIFMAKLVDDIASKASMQILEFDAFLLVGGMLFFTLVFRSFNHYLYYQGTNIWEKTDAKLSEKMMSMDYEYMESETIQNKRRDINTAASYNASGLNMLFWQFSPVIEKSSHVIIALIYTIYLLSRCKKAFPGGFAAAFLFGGGFALLFLLLLTVMLLKNREAQKEIYNCNMEMMPDYRTSLYYMNEYIEKEECEKTIRMFHQQKLLSFRLKELYQRIMGDYKKLSKGYEKQSVWLSAVEAVISVLIYFMLGILVLKGAITVGNICLYAGCISNFLLHFRELVARLTELAENTKYVKMYFDFIDIPNKKYEGTLPVEKRDDDKFTIEFRHVSFHYPGSDVDVLKDFSIQFHIGERLAVVGRNGSGKTTFIKLLCRLYDPTEGEILLNGINIKKYDYGEYLSLFSVVFQDFQIPALPLGEVVSVSGEYEVERVLDALSRAGLRGFTDKLPSGLKTSVYRDFDKNGVDISGGEAQKLAIARALYHDTPFVILDEPTASLDPLAEYEIYSKFDELVGTKTAVYISHRLSSCQFCNDILVIDEGRAVQRGSHEKLVAEKEGLYYTLWHTQAQYYREEVNGLCGR